MNNIDKIYDELTAEMGEIVNNEYVKIIENDTVEKEYKNTVRNMNSYAYGDTGPIPGETINDYLDTISDVKKEDAISNMVAQSAILKAQAEAGQKKKLTAKEKAERKKMIVDQLLYQQQEAYYIKNHYIMDGTTKRRTRKKLERMYDKGRFGSLDGKSLND